MLSENNVYTVNIVRIVCTEEISFWDSTSYNAFLLTYSYRYLSSVSVRMCNRNTTL